MGGPSTAQSLCDFPLTNTKRFKAPLSIIALEQEVKGNDRHDDGFGDLVRLDAIVDESLP